MPLKILSSLFLNPSVFSLVAFDILFAVVSVFFVSFFFTFPIVFSFILLPAFTMPVLKFPDLQAKKAFDNFFKLVQSLFSSADTVFVNNNKTIAK